MTKTKISWIEVLICLAVCLILARFIWAEELLIFETNLFAKFGVSLSFKYLLTLPFFLLVLFSYYKRDKKRLADSDRPVISMNVLIFGAVSLFLCVIYLYFFVGGQK
jgi:hypothetical protein